MLDSKLTDLQRTIEREAFLRNGDGLIAEKNDPNGWIFDFRRILMRGDVSNRVTDLFYERFNERYPFQVCTLEVGGIPLLTAIVNKFFSRGVRDINGFFIRKSRKKSGLMQMVEGSIMGEKKIVLVDDTMNSGDSFWRQIVVLEELGYKVDIVWSIIRYRDLDFYTRFHNRGIKIESLFTLDDFTQILGERVANLRSVNDATCMPFRPLWVFKSDRPSLEHVVPKSQPILDEDTLYVGSDNRTFWAINQSDGSVKWKFKVGPHTKRKSIFSSPALYDNLVIFGAYDGNVYALDRETGKKQWVSFEADWVGSSPAVASKLGLVFIGLEFGLFRRHGGIAALDIRTGKTMWCDYTHHALTHASPTYIDLHEQVVIGSNEGIVRLYDARTGDCLWKFTTFGGAEYDTAVDAGFGKGEIKQGIVYDEAHDFLIFGATDGFLYILERRTGHLVHHYKCEFAIWGTPYVSKGKVYFTALDKRVRAINLETFALHFEREVDGTRLFGSPTVIDGRLYVGTNGARLYELDPESGKTLGYFQTLERITNTVVQNQKTKRFFLPTYANEIICLERTECEPSS